MFMLLSMTFNMFLSISALIMSSEIFFRNPCSAAWKRRVWGLRKIAQFFLHLSWVNTWDGSALMTIGSKTWHFIDDAGLSQWHHSGHTMSFHLANLYFVNAVNVIVSSSPLCTNTETVNMKTALRKTVWNISLTLCWIFENQLKLLRSRSCLFIETVFAPPSVLRERTKPISIVQISLDSDY